LIVSKEAQFRKLSVHGTGEAFVRGEGTDCAGCHGTEGAKARINAGLPPHDPSVEGVTNVSPFDCRTCHNIHTTYTKADFSLTGDAQPVVLEKTGGTFDGGKGNLCANCHQIRNDLPVASGGNIDLGRQTGSRSDPRGGPGNQVRRSQGRRARDSATTRDCGLVRSLRTCRRSIPISSSSV
jgi:hypothetical protein